MKTLRIRFAGLLLLAGVFLAYGPAHADTPGDNPLQRDVQTLSSESFEGRGVGRVGLERALNYVEKRFQEAGLRPFGGDGYRQSFAGPDGKMLVSGSFDGTVKLWSMKTGKLIRSF